MEEIKLPPTMELSVVLVHGTWARGLIPISFKFPWMQPRWFEDGSDFVEGLKQNLSWRAVKFTIHTFLWSGANSILERDTAARAVASMIEEINAERPGIRQVLIAHSHGGNVAMRSLAYLEDSVPSPMIATLATPFVEVIPKMERDRWSPTSDSTFFFLLLLPTTFLLYAVICLPFLPLSPPTWLNVAFLVLALPFVGLLHAALFPDPIKAIRRARELAAASSFAHVYRRNDVQMLILRAVDDEAALSLAVGAIGTRIITLLAIVGSIATKLAASVLVLLFFAMIAAGFVVGFVPPPETVLRAAFFTVIFGPSVVLTSWLFAGACRCVYGRELFFKSFRCDVSSHSVPDNLGINCPVQTLEATSKRGLRHGIYDEPSSWILISRWLAGRLGQQDGTFGDLMVVLSHKPRDSNRDYWPDTIR